MDADDIDWLIPHQANLRIIQATAKRLQMPMERVIVTVDKHGNTSSGSVPLALDDAVRTGKVQRGQNLLLEAFGGGFTWASAMICAIERLKAAALGTFHRHAACRRYSCPRVLTCTLRMARDAWHRRAFIAHRRRIAHP